MAEENDMNVKLARIEVHLSQVTTQISQVLALILGTGDQPGIVVRLDRLEQTESRRAKLVWIAIAAAATALAKAMLS